ncbi:MAG: Fpg/Nei family DNA glycosylase [Renibacterium sp.]|nr:Fpg/Nei family DNA glycosylase [Renibacterium sp.]
MPEGDTVWRQTVALDAALRGKEILRSDFRVPAFATVDLRGSTVSRAYPRGKHLLIETASVEGRITVVHSHLKMEGSWQLYRPGEPWRRPAHTARAVLEVADAVAVGFSLGLLEVLPAAELDLDFLGPDLLGPDWDAAEAQRRLEADPQRPIGAALLDQRNLAGIGNIYRNELCFLVGAHPERPTASVDLPRILGLAKRLLEANKARSLRSTTGSAARADAASWVYRREHLPCRRCGTRIRQEQLDGRTIFSCPHCQPRDW